MTGGQRFRAEAGLCVAGAALVRRVTPTGTECARADGWLRMGRRGGTLERNQDVALRRLSLVFS